MKVQPKVSPSVVLVCGRAPTLEVYTYEERRFDIRMVDSYMYALKRFMESTTASNTIVGTPDALENFRQMTTLAKRHCGRAESKNFLTKYEFPEAFLCDAREPRYATMQISLKIFAEKELALKKVEISSKERAVLALVGHGNSEGGFALDACNPGSMFVANLKPSVLAQEIDTLLDKAGKIVVVLNACFSGNMAVQAANGLKKKGEVLFVTSSCRGRSSGDPKYHLDGAPVDNDFLSRYIGNDFFSFLSGTRVIREEARDQSEYKLPANKICEQAFVKDFKELFSAYGAKDLDARGSEERKQDPYGDYCRGKESCRYHLHKHRVNFDMGEKLEDWGFTPKTVVFLYLWKAGPRTPFGPWWDSTDDTTIYAWMELVREKLGSIIRSERKVELTKELMAQRVHEIIFDLEEIRKRYLNREACERELAECVLERKQTGSGCPIF